MANRDASSAIDYVLMDIEGTTTPITFVHDVLFPYAAERLPAYVDGHGHKREVQTCLDETAATVRQEEGRDLDTAGAVQQLLRWTKEDRKHPALKRLQGMIWEDGYKEKAFTTQVYPDVKPALVAWKERGWTLGIYSSGSVPAQKLLFAHTEHGDLTPLLSNYFDTAVGAKREPQAYERILAELERKGPSVVFLSDIVEELDAAATQRIKTVQLVRPGTKAGSRHPTAATFADVDRLLS